MVFNATFNNISAISWQSVLLTQLWLKPTIYNANYYTTDAASMTSMTLQYNISHFPFKIFTECL
jgi:hypothetical protein